MSVHITSPSLLGCADVIQLVEADAIYEEFGVNANMGKDEAPEAALWHSRLFACQKLGTW